ncbi:MAG: PadR family transcriptional regulator [Candidatus Aminicenantes bacterium]|nr:PadR family transcriptional regulator [Candidatus Aminicenantes bacterium]
MTKQTIDSDLSLAILGLLSMQAMSGYGLRKVFLTTAMKAFSASPGAIYPALQRLERAGLIEGTVEKKNTLRPRMVYDLTRAGRARLLESLSRPVTREDVIRRMDGLLLRFSFMSGLVGTDEMLDFLRALAAETESYLEVIEGDLREFGPGLPFSGRSALEQGVESFRTTARWARKTLAEFEKLHSSKGGRR